MSYQLLRRRVVFQSASSNYVPVEEDEENNSDQSWTTYDDSYSEDDELLLIHDEDTYSDDSEWDMWSSEDLWQSRPGRESPVVTEPHTHHVKPVNTLVCLQGKEIGHGDVILKEMVKQSLLKSIIEERWSTVNFQEIFEDAKIMLDRRLYRWEGRVLEHLVMSRLYTGETSAVRGNTLMDAMSKSQDFLPISFNELVKVLIETGSDLNSYDCAGRNLFMTMLEEADLHRDGEEFISFLLDSGFDVKKSINEVVMALCYPSRPVSDYKLQVIKKVFETGHPVDKDITLNPLTVFLRNVYEVANENAVQLVRVLIEKGYNLQCGLLSMGSIDPRSVYLTAGKVRHILAICHILLDNGAPTNPPKACPWSCFLFELLHFTGVFAHPSLLHLVQRCIELGLDVKVTGPTNESLLIAVCSDYKHHDLPELVQLLCQSGCDVNHVDRQGKNALLALAENSPNFRQEILEATHALLDHGIRVNHADANGSNGLLSMVLNVTGTCCKYGSLLDLNKSAYWDLLDLLVDAGTDVNQVYRHGWSALMSMLFHWGRCNQLACSQCLIKHGRFVSMEEAPEIRGIEHFRGLLNFVERLLKAGAKTEPHFDRKVESMLLFVCAHYKGDELIALVELLCKYGADVNATTARRPGGYIEYYGALNAVDILRVENRSQIYRIRQVVDILKKYGFNDSC